MEVYTGRQSVLDAVLGEFKEQGFKLIEDDDHVVKLYHNNKRVAVYSQVSVTVELIRLGCQIHLDNLVKHKEVK